MAACTNLPSKLSRAICAYLVTLGIPQEQVFPQFSAKPRTFASGPIVTPLIYPGEPDPKFTGDRKFKVAVSIGGTITTNSGSEDAKEAQRVAFDAMVGQVYEALMQTDENDDQTLDATRVAINAAGRAMAAAGTADQESAKEPWRKAANNADMADFTVTQWNDSTFGAGEAKDCSWEIVIMFDASANESNTD